MYSQCVMKKILPESSKDVEVASIDIAWIPIKYAKKGKFLELKINNRWDNGWQVMSVGAKQETIESQEYTKHREVTDI